MQSGLLLCWTGNKQIPFCTEAGAPQPAGNHRLQPAFQQQEDEFTDESAGYNQRLKGSAATDSRKTNSVMGRGTGQIFVLFKLKTGR